MGARIISILNHKGGVGKTTTTLNLGKALSLSDRRVLIVDMDPQANLSQSVGIEEPETNVYHVLCDKAPLPILTIGERLDIVPADLDLTKAEMSLQARPVEGYFQLKNAVQNFRNDYDFILIDCPPSLGILTINALIASQEVLIVLQSQYLATKGMDTIMEMVSSVASNMNASLKIAGVLLTQVDNTVLSRTIAEQLHQAYGDLVYQTAIRRNVAVGEASTQKQDIFTYNVNCAAAQDYRTLAEEVLTAGHPHGTKVSYAYEN